MNEKKKRVGLGLSCAVRGDSYKFIPSDDDLCRMLAKVIMKTSGLDATRALACAGERLRARRLRQQAEQEARDRAAWRLWMKMAGKL